MSSIKGIRNLTGLLLKLVPHQNKRSAVHLPQILCQTHCRMRKNTIYLRVFMNTKEENYSPLELI